jgi:hypothetical protein
VRRLCATISSMRARARKPPRRSPSDIDRDIRRAAALLPDIDPGDLDLIVRSLARPFGTGRRFFLREIAPGVRIF